MVHGADFAAAEVARIAAARSYLRADMESAPTPSLIGRPVCQKTSTLPYRECRGEHCSPANLAQQRSFGKASHKANGHGRAMLAPTMRFFDSLTPSFIGRLFCCAAICTKQVRLYLYKITTKFARSSGKTAKYASKTAACAKNTPIVPQSATIESTQKHGPAFDRCYTV